MIGVELFKLMFSLFHWYTAANVDPCESRPCLNGGTCSRDVEIPQMAICRCPAGVKGLNCELAPDKNIAQGRSYFDWIFI